MLEVQNKSSFDYANEIWNIADYVRDVIKPSDYNKLILPFSLLRRLECSLEPTRESVIEAFEKNEAEWGRESDNYCTVSKKPFYNVTRFRLDSLGAYNTLDALMAYVDGFSPNARDIMTRFKMEETCKTLQEHDMLYEVCKRFSAFDLSPENVSDRTMSDIYEHLIQKFGEAIAEGAEDFMTPRDVVRLAVSMLFANEDEVLNSDRGDVRTLYDPTAGTCGFITDALDMIEELHQKKEMIAPARIVPYGQEVEATSWAMGKANLLLRNISNNDKDQYDTMSDLSQYIAYGNTLSDDKFEDMKFDYQLSNPPYGKKWEKEKSDVIEEATKLGFDGRFGAGTPPVNDGSMLFLQHVINKMRPASEGGGKAGIVLSASPLFTGDAGSGCSNIRRWIFENDFIDCIVKLPESIFFRTGINTYLWILSNKKPESRRGMIQLIDASDCKTLLRKNLGKKRFEISEENQKWIVQTYVDGEINDRSVIVPYTDFMFRQVTTRQPLHAILKFDTSKINELMSITSISKLSDSNKDILSQCVANFATKSNGEYQYSQAKSLAKEVRGLMNKPKITVAQFADAFTNVFAIKYTKYPIAHDDKGNIVYDSDLNDTENIPWDMNFDTYMEKEVLPYANETIIDYSVLDKGPLQDGETGVVGTNISFNKYFYKYEEPRKPKEIENEISLLEKEFAQYLRGVFNE